MIHHAEIFPAARMDFNSIYVKQNDKHPSKSKSKFMSKYSTVMLHPKETETPTMAQNVVKVLFHMRRSFGSVAVCGAMMWLLTASSTYKLQASRVHRSQASLRGT